MIAAKKRLSSERKESDRNYSSDTYWEKRYKEGINHVKIIKKVPS